MKKHTSIHVLLKWQEHRKKKKQETAVSVAKIEFFSFSYLHMPMQIVAVFPRSSSLLHSQEIEEDESYAK